MPAIAKMLPAGTRFQCLADYGAKDIAANLWAWQPVIDAGKDVGMISWLEFDGLMALGQGWMESLAENIKQAAEMGVRNVTFNHWRVRSLEHNAAVASVVSWDARLSMERFKEVYFDRLYGRQNKEKAQEAYRLLEDATLYGKSNTFNSGFTGDWVFRISTNARATIGPAWQSRKRTINARRLRSNILPSRRKSKGGSKRAICRTYATSALCTCRLFITFKMPSSLCMAIKPGLSLIRTRQLRRQSSWKHC